MNAIVDFGRFYALVFAACWLAGFGYLFVGALALTVTIVIATAALSNVNS